MTSKLQLLHSFTPDYLDSILKSHSMNNITPVSSMSEFFQGVCLLVDISGFTNLSEKYCSIKKDGVDKLQTITSGFLGQLVDIIYTHHGDVMKFAGDALICLFKGDDLDSDTKGNSKGGDNDAQEIALSRAIQCAMVLKDETMDILTLHIGVSYGDVCFGILGGYGGQFECLISGSLIQQLSQCLDDAKSKCVVVTKEFYDEIQHNKRVTVTGKLVNKETKNYEIESIQIIKVERTMQHIDRSISVIGEIDDHINKISCFVPPPAVDAILANSYRLMGEMRKITTIFMKFDGYDAVGHKNLSSLDRYFLEVQSILSYQGGFLRQLIVDDKGLVAIMLWGVPTASYLDNCIRAVKTAEALRKSLSKLKMVCSFGVTTGHAYCGTVGHLHRQEYAAIGDYVNLAARLMAKSNGSIYIDENTYSELNQSLQDDYILLPPMKVKGKDKEIKAYEYNSDKFAEDSFDLRSRSGIVLRDACKEPFELLMNYLDKGKRSEKLLSHQYKPKNDQSSTSKSKSDSKKYDSQIHFLVLQGSICSGADDALTWIHGRCKKMNVKINHFKLLKSDAYVSYSCMKKLFCELIDRENFNSDDRQFYVVSSLLKTVYPRDKSMRENIAYHCMKTVFGITCGLQRSQTNRSDHHVVDEVKKDTKIPTIPPLVMTQCIIDILKVLFEVQTLVIIEDAHELDKESWKILSYFNAIASKSVIVFTQNIEPANNTMSSRQIVAEDDDLLARKSAYHEWTDHCLKVLSVFNFVVCIKLPSYTLDETRIITGKVLAMHKFALNSSFHIIIFQLSGGNPFWVREILNFIVENGDDSFMKLSVEISVSKIVKHGTADSGSFSFLSKSTFSQGSISSASMEIPQSSLDEKLRLFIICRFAKLPTIEQAYLKLASIIGNEFDISVLMHLLPDKDGDDSKDGLAVSVLESLIKAHWIIDTTYDDGNSLGSNDRSSSSGRITSCSFTNLLIYRTLYDLTPTSTKQSIHRKIGEYMQSISADRILLCKYIGYHYLQSGYHSKALQYMLIAGMHEATSTVGNIYDCMALIYLAMPLCRIGDDIECLKVIIAIATDRVNQGVAEKVVQYDLHNVGCLNSVVNTFRKRDIESSALDEDLLSDLLVLNNKIALYWRDRDIASSNSDAISEDVHSSNDGAWRKSILSYKVKGDNTYEKARNSMIARSKSKKNVVILEDDDYTYDDEKNVVVKLSRCTIS